MASSAASASNTAATIRLYRKICCSKPYSQPRRKLTGCADADASRDASSAAWRSRSTAACEICEESFPCCCMAEAAIRLPLCRWLRAARGAALGNIDGLKTGLQYHMSICSEIFWHVCLGMEIVVPVWPHLCAP